MLPRQQHFHAHTALRRILLYRKHGRILLVMLAEPHLLRLPFSSMLSPHRSPSPSTFAGDFFPQFLVDSTMFPSDMSVYLYLLPGSGTLIDRSL